MTKPLALFARARSFGFAFRGVWLTLRSQPNAWIHAVATIGVVVAGVAVGLSCAEWCLVVLASAAVWTAEALNTALEFLADAVSRETHPLIGQAKDVAAGAVLITAGGALAVGALVFLPHFTAK